MKKLKHVRLEHFDFNRHKNFLFPPVYDLITGWGLSLLGLLKLAYRSGFASGCAAGASDVLFKLGMESEDDIFHAYRRINEAIPWDDAKDVSNWHIQES